MKRRGVDECEVWVQYVSEYRPLSIKCHIKTSFAFFVLACLDLYTGYVAYTSLVSVLVAEILVGEGNLNFCYACYVIGNY